MSVTLVLANSFGGHLFKSSKAQIDHAAERPEISSANGRPVSGADGSALTLWLPSIRCQGCVETIEASFRLVPGIVSIAGDVKKWKICVAYRSVDTSPDEIESAVTRLGHSVDRSEGQKM